MTRRFIPIGIASQINPPTNSQFRIVLGLELVVVPQRLGTVAAQLRRAGDRAVNPLAAAAALVGTAQSNDNSLFANQSSAACRGGGHPSATALWGTR